jgi:hypothetical protein
MKPLQTTLFPRVGSQQANALPLQSAVIPAQSVTPSEIDLSSLMSLMITMMIVMMMMKMMAGMMEGVSGSSSRGIRY